MNASSVVSKTIRTSLFVPGDRGERIPKALASGADGIIVDLEDAVAAEAKAQARQIIREFLDANPAARVLVRINAADTREHAEDLALASHPGVAAVLLPKAETAEQVRHVNATCGKPVWPIVETALGVLAVPELVRAQGVERLALGTLDLGLDLDLKPGSVGGETMLDQARFTLMLHSRAAHLPPPIDGVYPALADKTGLAEAAARSRAAGMGGMLCIHPSQVEIINAAFSPGQGELDWARRVVETAKQSNGAFSLDGQMVDAPVIEQAARILQRAGS
ncbi:HpcH/HpaI aldolase/citrate lyase family protein [Pseudogulbenkiania ferrooxidans]|uniref:HpcH/HpaI aldolase n=1 Tax=Pseudogulbenkiania ferrooxidans 2002 TaxID=279714 RepID=B9Z0Q4_9NEIS|nr:CoA ester lyase [Pseudogulbenkiania ferrooxidans]EEG09660.1 HpcH/HpaI aldolase [Pseudogulbenkiania ferrooxidans 2002]